MTSQANNQKENTVNESTIIRLDLYSSPTAGGGTS